MHRHGTWPASRWFLSSVSRAKHHAGARGSAQTLGLMSRASSVVMIALLALVGSAIAEPLSCSGYQAALRSMATADVAVRSQWSEATGIAIRSRAVELTEIVDRKNTDQLKQLLARCGWPKLSVHGEQAVSDAWLLAQHADKDLPFQEEVLGFIQLAVTQGEAPADLLAFLSDRVALAHGKPQLYGTQLQLHEPCRYEFRPFDDRSKVEARRQAMGLSSLAEYKALVE